MCGKFMAKDETLLSLANIKAVNEKGQSSVDIDRVDQQVVNTGTAEFCASAQIIDKRQF
jgi:colanic acid biosynthesis protein WcaM